MAEKLIHAFISLFCLLFAGLHFYGLNHNSNTATEAFSLKFSAACWLLSGVLQGIIALFVLLKKQG